MNLKVGNVVTLKSGGPEMTVKGVTEFNVSFPICCCWHTTKGKLVEAYFPEEALDKVADLTTAMLENITKAANLKGGGSNS